MKLVVALAALLIALPANAAARFAVVVGNNVGATGRAKLWFAERDAERFARALRELGDFSEDRITIVRSVEHAGEQGDETRVGQLRTSRAMRDRTGSSSATSASATKICESSSPDRRQTRRSPSSTPARRELSRR